MTIVSRVLSIVTLAGLPRTLQIGIYSLAGVALGMALVLARITNAGSYLSDDPQTCINCHVMTHAYASWQRGSHGHAAVCVDCHVPHDHLVARYAFKAWDGLRHSYVFTMRTEPQVLELSAAAVPVVQTNCVRCHADQLEMVRLAETQERRCWDCHQNIHGEVRSLSGSPPELRPSLPPAGIGSRRALPVPGTRALPRTDGESQTNDRSSIINNP
ncbi:MAG: cytochrome c nitrite reductase small subunit [Planctomycetes bacterium]|nr:cytochrome c nitrite reductase small subunit [Planctomycetota bacterium]